MKSLTWMQIHILAFFTGFLLDLLIGDPHRMPHPVRWIGAWISFWDRRLLGTLPEDPAERHPGEEQRKGRFLVLAVLGTVLLCSAAVLLAAYRLSVRAGFAAEAVLTCYTLAAASLRRESMVVYDALHRGDLSGARRVVSRIVGRDTDALDETGVTKAAVETIAENLSDGVIAPMLYGALGGPVLGLLYKAVNTMDSMIGYRNDRYQWFGTAAARLDDAANYLPSRLSALLIIAASAVSGRTFDPAGAYRIWKRDRYNHKSPNAAQTESAAAGALSVELAGDARYFGKIVHKPTIGDPIRPVVPEDIPRMNRLMITAAVLGEALCLIILSWISRIL